MPRHLPAVTVVVITLCIGVFGQQSKPAQSSETNWLSSWREAVVSFGVVEKDSAHRDYYKVIGTGIVISTSPTRGYLVTAKHVFFEPSKSHHPSELHIRYPWQEQSSVYDELGTTIQLRDSSGGDLWTAADDGSDIAAIPLNPSRINQPAAPLEIVATKEELFEGESVIVLGFPGIVGNEYLVRAISRGGIVAWLSPTGAETSAFLIDANIYPGNSGGPVIKVPSGFDRKGNFVMGGRAALLGIVSRAPGQSGDVELRVPGMMLPLRIHQEIPLGGTGVVEPAAKVQKLLRSLSDLTRHISRVPCA